jgi:subtilisin family serine protease
MSVRATCRASSQVFPNLRRTILVTLVVTFAFAAFVPLRPSAAQDEDMRRASPVKTQIGAAEFVPGEVLVRFRENAKVAISTLKKTETSTPTVLRARARDIIADIKDFEGSEMISGLRLASVAHADTLAAIEALRQRTDVIYAEPNYVRRKNALPNDPRFGDMWGLKNTGQTGFNDLTQQQQSGTPGADIDAELAWNITTGNRNVVVGVVDEGVDINHTDLRANIWRNPGETPADGIDNDGNGFIDDINGWDFYHNDASVYDGAAGDNATDSHGTHVAGTIGATGNNGIGVTGVNWQVSLMSLKILGKECTPKPSCDPPAPSSVRKTIAAYNYARLMRERGVNLRVLNNSYGGGGESQFELDAIRQLNSAGILFVAAAGNDALDSGNFPHFPAGYDVPNVIAVAATNRFDDIAAFSTFGARTVSMGAPGRGVLSTLPNNTYDFFSGTSMATPHVAGTAALVLAAYPNISVANLRGVLAYTGDAIPALLGKTTTGRRLNAFNALLAAAENDMTAPAVISDLRVAEQTGRNLTLAWTAVGDDGNTGQAADYDFAFTNSITGFVTITPATLSTLLPRPAGTLETATIQAPYRNFAGTVELRVHDNAGNTSRTSLAVTISVNSGSDPYQPTQSGATALSTGGTPLGLIGDDRYRENYQLPFAFPFFGQNRNTVTISTNGNLYFSTPPRRDPKDLPTGTPPEEIADDAGSSIEDLNRYAMIAGLWDDIQTDFRPGDDVFVTAQADRIIFRWQGVTFNTPLSGGTTRGNNPVNFEIELRRDGTIQTRYGDGNTRLFPVVGISAGEPEAYVIASHTSESSLKNLTAAQTVSFTPRPTVQLHSISGRVTDGFGNSISGATVTLSGARSAIATTDANGNYSFADLPAGGNYILSPSKAGQFTAFGSNLDNLNSNQVVNLMLSPFVSVQVRVTDASGNPLGDVAIRRDNDTLVRPRTNSSGNVNISYAVPAINNTTITLTPERDNFTFNPSNVTFNSASGNQIINFVGTPSETVTLTADAIELRTWAVNGRTQAFVKLTFPTNAYRVTSWGAPRFLDDGIEINAQVARNLGSALAVTNTTANIYDLGALSPRTTNLRFSTSGTLVKTLTFTVGGATTANPLDDAGNFARQHYIDFLSREPDAPGLDFWTREVSSCNGDARCVDLKRVNVSGSFFLSQEFQVTGYYVYRMYKGTLGRAPYYAEFAPDLQRVSNGIVANNLLSADVINRNKADFRNRVCAPPRISRALRRSVGQCVHRLACGYN